MSPTPNPDACPARPPRSCLYYGDYLLGSEEKEQYFGTRPADPVIPEPLEIVEQSRPDGRTVAWQEKVRRLVCEHPDVYRDFIAGRYTSIKTAARAAGICPPERRTGRKRKLK
jgi:hypothetical protein